MRAAAAALLVAWIIGGCAPRLAPPIVQTWTAVLTEDGERVLVATTVQAIYPVVTWTIACAHEPGIHTIRTGAACPRVRTFRATRLDRRRRIVVYTAVRD